MMTLTLQEIRRLAPGSEQRYWLLTLLRGNVLRSPSSTLRGRAARYADRYAKSFHSLLGRLKAAGYQVERTPGPRGGEWSATYRLAGPEVVE